MRALPHFTARQLNALLSVCVVVLFGVMAHVNMLDNIEHIAAPHHHDHSVLSVLDADHHDDAVDTTNDEDTTEKGQHSHPNLTGSVVFPDIKHYAARQAYGITEPVSWQRLDGLEINVSLADERPPKANA